MRSMLLALAIASLPVAAAHAGEAVTYAVDGETFEGYRSKASGQAKGLVLTPIFIAHGGADTSVSMNDVAALSGELESAGVPYEMHVYSGAPHGFTEWSSDRYQKRADEESWDAFSDFLATNLAG